MKLARAIVIGLLMIGGSAHAQDNDTLDELLEAQPTPVPTPGPEPTPTPTKASEADTPPQPYAESIAVPTQTPPVSPPRSHRVVEEIVVTATKRAESTRDIPITIDAFSGKDLEAHGDLTMEDIVQNSPGVTYSKNLGADAGRVTIRGIETSLGVLNGAMTFGILLDSIPLVNPVIGGAMPDLDPFDMRTVEVLKGPQGTLFGGAALAGALRYVPNEPDFEQRQARLLIGTLSSADSDTVGQAYGLMLNQPFGERTALRLAATYRIWPGVYDDLTPGSEGRDIDTRDTGYGRAMLSFEPTEALDFQLLYQRVKLSENDSGFADNAQRLTRANTPGPTPTDSTVDIYGGRLQYAFDSMTASLHLARIDKDRFSNLQIDRALGTNQCGDCTRGPFYSFSSTDSIELRFVSNGPSRSEFLGALLSDWNWVGGLFYLGSDATVRVLVTEDPTGPVSGGGLVPVIPPGSGPDAIAALDVVQSGNAVERAAFVDLTRAFDSGLELNLGGRYFVITDEQVVTNSSNGVDTQNDTFPFREAGFNPKAALTWRPRDNIAVRASAAKGFRFGGTNFFIVPVKDMTAEDTYRSDTLWSYEVGIRSDWLDGALTADFTLFQIDWKDLQIIQNSVNGVDQFTSNIGAARVRGSELAIQAALPWNFDLRLGASNIQGITTKDFESADGTVPAGSELPASPDLQGTATLSHHLTSDAWLLTSSVTQSYKSEAYSNIQQTFRLHPLSTTDISLMLQNTTWIGQPRVQLVVSNLFNHLTPGYILGKPNATNPDYFFNRPRTAMLQLELSL